MKEENELQVLSTANCNDLLKDLEELVSINSQSANIPGIKKVNEWIKHFVADLNPKIIEIPNLIYQSADLLHCIFPAKTEDFQTIALVLHSDTVLSPNNKSPIKIEGQKAFGSGIADMKGGIVSCLYGLKNYLNSCEIQNLEIHLIVSPNEEVGSLGFHDYFRLIGEKCDYAFCFEPALEDESLIVSRSGNKWYSLKTKSSSFHTGRACKYQYNPCHALSELIVSLKSKVMPIEGLKFHVSSIQSNSEHFNRSSSLLECRLDVRFNCRSQVKYFDECLSEELKQFFVEGMNVTVHDDCPTMKNNPLHLASFQEKILQFAPQIKFSSTTGCSDINYFSAEKNVCLDGLGAIGSGMHSRREFIYWDKLPKKAGLVSKILFEL
ncbi:MAG: M20/M25/M40 family metallo-hydrolase [Halobacteriovoraceae bacterium]|nr:M20/M25/M40 family metallo-hydrolase [Halobacteriovoraceae bacterium]MCB9095217.1 M20/M25/M40 family metallo-hydrolase [Halobacteriovoraceae bacterium]